MAYIIPEEWIPDKWLAWWKRWRVPLVIGFFLLTVLVAWLVRDKKGTWNTYVMTPKPRASKKRVRFEDEPSTVPAPQGADSKGEVECREALKRMFRRPFDKARPDFLRNDVTGGKFNLELDCFDPELKLAVEYQGRQHYEFVPYWHRTKSEFMNQKYRDEIKRMKCKEAGVVLVEVPYKVKHADIETYLRKEFAARGIVVPY